MSFLDDLKKVGSDIYGLFKGSSTATSIAKAALTGYLLNKVTSSITKDNQTPAAATNNRPDPGVREQVDPDTEHSVPVVYGQAYLGGVVTDARLTADGTTMYYCITICEQTGTKISDSQPSVISFEEIYWDRLRIVFRNDGITLAKLVSEDGVEAVNAEGLIQIYCYSGNSQTPVVPKGYFNDQLADAWDVFPQWTTNHRMEDLVFVIVKVTYNAAANVKGLGDISFKLRNTMTLPGDCLHDYMTNTRYGAGITAEEINTFNE